MCIGIPMQVLQTEPGFATCRGRGERRRVATLLVGDVEPGEWLLVFLGDARERIDAERAAEVNATLDLLDDVMQGCGGSGDAGFMLPSSLSAQDIAAFVNPSATTTINEENTHEQ